MPRSDAAETDPALLHLADVDVAERGHGDDVLAALVVGEGEGAALRQRVVHGRVDLVDALVGLERELASDVLDADPDLHCGAFRRGAEGVVTPSAVVGGSHTPPGASAQSTAAESRLFHLFALGETADAAPGELSHDPGGLLAGDLLGSTRAPV